MKKRLLSLALVLALALTFAVPALADTQNTDELTQVTLSVKEALGIGDEYENFSSDITDIGVTRLYSLYWYAEEKELSVEAGSDGTIYYYYLYSDETYYSESSGYTAALPQVKQATLKTVAETFLEKVLPEGQSVTNLKDANLNTSGQQTSVSVSGTLQMNGVPTDVTLTVRINLSTLTVRSYSRSDAWDGVYVGEVPSATPAVTAQAAKETLRGVQALELCYVQDDDDNIVLRYVPVTEGDWYVDAQTGEAVDLSAVEAAILNSRNWAAGSLTADATEEEAATESASLSDVEQEAIAEMAGTLDADTLDAKLRQYAELGLTGMTRTGASYTTTPDTGEIRCRLTYTRTLARDEVMDEIDDDTYEELSAAGELTVTKRITVDAKDGSLVSLYTFDYYAKEQFDGDGQAVAESFLSALYPEQFAECTLEEDSTYSYVRTANGVPYYSNYLNVSVSEADGSISSFYMDWDEDAQFPAADNVIGMEAAMDAYMAQYEAVLQYTAYPVAVDTSDAEWLTYSQEMGYAAYQWVLSYVLDTDASCYGIDATTGEALCYAGSGTSEAVSYTDISQSYAKDQIEALAAYGVGFGAADTFQPTKQLTQKEALVLFVNASSSYYDFDVDTLDEEALDELYSLAEEKGLITGDTRDPDAPVTRMDLLKMLIGATAYGKAAQLSGIYKTSFSDASSIAESDLGYAAIAEALGLVGGDENHALNPNRVATRQEAAMILYNYMTLNS